jgi:large subunit ribosomal protein L3
MINGIIGKKVGMTQLFTDDGRVIPVTVIKAGPCLVVQKKIKEGNEHLKVQLGYVEEKKVKNVKKSAAGHFEKAKIPVTRVLKEFFIEQDNINVGDTVKADIFQEEEIVDVVGITKGKGFQGVVKRWNYKGGRSSHGSMFHRRPGSIGASAFPSRVIKGKKLPGRMGGKRRTIRHLRIVKIDLENNYILVKGAIPGFKGNYVSVIKESFNRR